MRRRYLGGWPRHLWLRDAGGELRISNVRINRLPAHSFPSLEKIHSHPGFIGGTTVRLRLPNPYAKYARLLARQVCAALGFTGLNYQFLHGSGSGAQVPSSYLYWQPPNSN